MVLTDADAFYELSNVNDASSNSRTLTNQNTSTFSTGLIGDAVYESSASKQMLYLTNWLAGATSGISFSIWLYFSSQPPANDGYTVQAGGGNSPHVSHILQYVNYPSGTYYINWARVRNGISSSHNITYTTTLATGTWHHIVGTSDGTTARLFINGVYRATAGTNVSNGSSSGGVTSTDFTIGRENYVGDDASYRYTDGRWDLVGVWQRALTYGGVALNSTAGGEVAQLYNAGAGYSPYGGVVANTSSMFLMF